MMANAKDARQWARNSLRGIGDYPESRPPQVVLPEDAKSDIRAAYRRFGLID